MFIWWIFLLTAPIFYLVGVISFFKSFFGKNEKTEILDKIEETLHHYPSISLKEFRDNLEIKSINHSATNLPVIDGNFDTPEKTISEKDASILNKDVGSLWENWYSNNSINLLLYIGAFLIVAAASIFVGFQWNTISGIIKGSVLSSLSLLFIICGFWFHGIPKIKSAGSTFIGIGALLIPVCGAGWYNFVLKDIGISAGTVWFTSSLISLGLFTYLSIRLKESFYSYASSLAVLSLSLSFVNVAGLNRQTYILAALMSSFILLITGLFAKKGDTQNYNHFGLPMEISAQVIMPITLFYGLIVAASDNLLFSLEGSASIFISSLFYFILYLEVKKPYALAATQLLLPIGFYLLYGWLDISKAYLLYTVGFIGLIYLYSSLLLKDKNTSDEMDISLFSGTTLSIFVFILSFAFNLPIWEKLMFSFFPIGAGISVAYIKKEINFAYISTAFIIISSWIFVTLLLPYPHNKVTYIAFILTGFGIAFFLENIRFKQSKRISDFLTVNTTVFISISIALSLSHPTIESILFLIASVIFWIARLVWGNPNLTYGMTAGLYISLFFAMQSMKIDGPLYPLVFTALSIILYAYQLATKRHVNEFCNTALVTQGALAFIYSTNIFIYSFPSQNLEYLRLNSLLTIYATMVFFFVDSYLREEPNVDYAASFFGLFALLAQLKYSGMENLLYYSIPTGIYLLIMGEVRKKHEGDSAAFLDFMGNTILLIFPFIMSYDKSYYSLVLGTIGIILLSIGITTRNKIYTHGGAVGLILAILPQTYSYILSLPKWILVGIVGVTFVGVAIFLLLNKKSDPE